MARINNLFSRLKGVTRLMKLKNFQFDEMVNKNTNKDLKKNEEIKNKDNEFKEIKKKVEKVFSKKRTKPNLFKEKINNYNNSIKKNNDKNNNLENKNTNTETQEYFITQNKINNPENPEYLTAQNKDNNGVTLEYTLPSNNIIIGNIKNDIKEDNECNTDNFIPNLLSNRKKNKYIIRKPGKRNISQPKIKKINYYLEPEKSDERSHRSYLSKSNEKNRNIIKNNNDLNNLNSYIENLIKTDYSIEYPFNNNNTFNNSKNNQNEIKTNVNLYRATISSQEESTNNHMTLIEESNETKNPINYDINSINNNTNYEEKNKKNPVRYFSPMNEYNNIPHQNYLMTDIRPKKIFPQQNMFNYNEDLYPTSYLYMTNKRVPIPNNYKNLKMSFSPQQNNIEGMPRNNNIYLYTNEEDLNNTNPNNPIYRNNNLHNKYINKTQYFSNNYFNDNNSNNKRMVPIYERMSKNRIINNNNKINKINNKCNSPLSRKVNKDKNKIRITYNMYGFPQNEEYNNNSNYENDTVYNNYNLKQIIY